MVSTVWSFRLFLASTTLNMIALSCVRFGVSWLAMHKTGSAATFAVIFSASSLVEVYSRPVLAPMADYFDRLKVFRACIGAGSLVMAALLGAALLLPLSVPLLTGLLMAQSLVASLRDPTSAGLVTALVKADQLTEAQSLRSTVNSAVSLGAPMLSALLLAAGGEQVALGTAAILSTLGLVVTLGVRLVDSGLAPGPKQWSTYLKTWHLRTVDGMRAVLMTRAERNTALSVSLTNAGLFPFFTVVLPLWVAKGLDASATMMATVEVAFGAGILIGSSLLAKRLNEALGRFTALVVGNGFLGAGLLGSAFVSNPAVLVACFAVSGIGFALFNINASTLRAVATPPEFRARMVAGVAFLSSCLNPFAAQGIGFVVEVVGAASGVAVCGTLILISTALLLRNTDARTLLTRTNGDIVGAYASMYPRAFVERQKTA